MKQPKIIWLEFQSCTGDSESFLRASYSLSRLARTHLHLLYHELLMVSAGKQSEEVLQEAIEKYSGQLIVVVEGSIPTKDNGIYCVMGGKSALQILKEIEPHAMALVSVGTCSAFGGLPAAKPNPTGAVGLESIVKSKPIINVPGCPPNPDVILGVILNYIMLGRLPEVDEQKRPLFAYSKTIHEMCYRHFHFSNRQYATSFDDERAKKGFCLYALGCKGPLTYNICASWKWNMQASWPIGSGHPCFGCSERDFWDRFSPFYRPIPRNQLPPEGETARRK